MKKIVWPSISRRAERAAAGRGHGGGVQPVRAPGGDQAQGRRRQQVPARERCLHHRPVGHGNK